MLEHSLKWPLEFGITNGIVDRPCSSEAAVKLVKQLYKGDLEIISIHDKPTLAPTAKPIKISKEETQLRKQVLWRSMYWVGN